MLGVLDKPTTGPSMEKQRDPRYLEDPSVTDKPLTDAHRDCVGGREQMIKGGTDSCSEWGQNHHSH